jgi:hypothetical protein
MRPRMLQTRRNCGGWNWSSCYFPALQNPRYWALPLGRHFAISQVSQYSICIKMSGAENQLAVHDVVFPENGVVDNLSDAVSKVSLRADRPSSQSPESVTDSLAKDKNEIHSRPFVMYSRPHLLFLHKSPLVCPPAGMPALKDWFGFVLSLTHSN